MNKNTKTMKRVTLWTVAVIMALFTFSWLTTNDAIADFVGTLGLILVPVAGVMAFIWMQEIDKATGRKKRRSKES